MAHQGTTVWVGASGTEYKYWIYPIGTNFKDEPGNYIYAKAIPQGHWAPIYIGETSSLHDRLADHEKLPCVNSHGGTHVHAHITSGGRQARLAEESDLLHRRDPPCND